MPMQKRRAPLQAKLRHGIIISNISDEISDVMLPLAIETSQMIVANAARYGSAYLHQQFPHQVVQTDILVMTKFPAYNDLFIPLGIAMRPIVYDSTKAAFGWALGIITHAEVEQIKSGDPRQAIQTLMSMLKPTRDDLTVWMAPSAQQGDLQ